MCIESLCRHLPCTEECYHSLPDEPSSLCCSITKVALSIAAVAIGIFSTTVFLATGNIIALGITVVAFGVAAVCLGTDGDQRSMSFSSHSHHFYNPNHPFTPGFLSHDFRPPRRVVRDPPPFLDPTSRVRVGDQGTVFSPRHTPKMETMRPEELMPVDEHRVHVGGGGLAAGGLPMGDEDRVPVGRNRW